jgi:glucose-6-phosphate isomerase
MTTPVDPTTTAAWETLTTLHASLKPDLRGWFAADPDRAKSLTFTAGDLYVDLSKNLLTSDVLDALADLADQVGLADRTEAMFSGEHINVTEDRAVLHTALRAHADSSLIVDGVDVIPEVHATLAKVYGFADQVRSGSWVGVTGQRITTVVNIGIGGSDLGPVMAYEALLPYVQEGLSVRFVSNIDPTDVAEKTKDLDPQTTLVIVASKTFTTLETLTNARLARTWLLDGLRAAGAIDDSDEAAGSAVAKHFVAVSTALDKVAEFGIDPENAFGFWDWVGGRYSVDSAIGTSLVVAIGSDNFTDFLAGFRTIDEHFRSTEVRRNVPALMGLLNVWYVNFFGAVTHAVLPYAQYLHRFPRTCSS